MYRIIQSLAPVIFVCLWGCGGTSDGRPTGAVSGKVTYNGRPLTSGSVMLLHPSGQPASGDIGADGGYKLQAVRGPNKIVIDSRGPSVPDPTPNAKPGMNLPGKSLIPEKYMDQDKSGLTLDVKAGQNKFDIELKD